MKRKSFMSLLSFLLVITILFGMSGTSLAADDEAVLSKLYYTIDSTKYSLTIDDSDLNNKEATLTLPYSYAGDTIDLSEGLDATCLSSYSYPIPRFDGDSTITVGSGSVVMTVSYFMAGDTEKQYTTTYTIYVTNDNKEDSEFSGTISKTTTMATDLTLSASDFTSKYDVNDGAALKYIIIEGSNPSYGTLKYDNTDYDFGNTRIYISDINTKKLVFDTNATGTGTKYYSVFAYDSEDNQVNENGVVLSINVSQASASDIPYSLYNNKTVNFSGSSFNSVCQTVTGSTLDYFKFTALPSSSNGTLYYGYSSSSSPGTAVSSSTSYTYDSSDMISGITFVPYSGYSGTLYINYTAYSTSGISYTGKVKITVSAVSTEAGTLTYSIDKDETKTLSASELNKKCNSLTGYTLNYVKFNSVSSGYLYYDYDSSDRNHTAVSTTRPYYYSTSKTDYISKVTYVPKSGYTGTVTISYSGVDTNSNSFTGSIKITVTDSGDSDVITYETDKDEEFTFDRSDFADVCDDYCDDDLDYVKFSSFPSSYGDLYYNYSSSNDDDDFETSDKFYYDGSGSKLYLSKLSYVPKSGYTGTFYITYTAVPDDKPSYTGKVKITVGNGGIDTITYKTDEDKKITFDEDDFDDVCDDYCDDDLDYINFTLPSSTYGKLYYDYDSSSDYDHAVKSTYKYYVDGSSSKYYLSKVTFVPKSGYEGTFYIKYTANPDDKDSYTGKIKITVGDSDSSSDTITYSVTNTSSVKFSASEFNKVCDNQTDETLSYVKFTLPSSSYGKLYYNYSSSNDDDTISSSDKFYYSGSSSKDYLSKVTFVPKSGYTGTVTIKYTGYNTDGDSYTGSVKIVVSGTTTTTTTSNVSLSAYFNDVKSNYSWAASSIDYLYKSGVVSGTSTTEYSPQNSISRADFIVMLCRAFNLKAANGVTTNFSDVNTNSYYYDSVIIAKSHGIAEGSGGYFSPTSNLTREDAMVLILRTLKISGKTLTKGTTSDISGFSDRGKISSYATEAVSTLVKANIIKGATTTTLNPKGSITRAEMAVILYRILNM